ncbi:MAG: tryptophan synthase subunit alpha [Cytophagales bacterium]|nr:tryptophan synthase subunit alpha [Armatimonadota bacterium]
MSRIANRFAALQAKNEKALVAFVTAGDPHPERTAEAVAALMDGGADIVELGIPFSDPLADGPTIQASSHRALLSGMTPPKVLEVVRQVRASGREAVPLVLMGAWNPVLQYGLERFAKDAVAAGADGAILTDLSPDEAGEWKRAADAAGFDTIFLLAPTSTAARMALVGKMASGFVYCVSRTGVTGAQSDVPDELPALIEAIRGRADGTPVCVGFGVGDPEQVAAISRYADGVVVGSVLVDLLHRERDNPRVLSLVQDFVASLKAATRGAAPL